MMKSAHRLVSLLLLLLACGCGKPGVKGTVTLNDTPIAAGQITFQPLDSDRSEFSTSISHGKFEIEQTGIGGNYKAVINIHFADAKDATHFYEAMSREINKEKILHGEEPELVDPELGHPEFGDPGNSDSPADSAKTKPAVENPAKIHEIEVTLSKGANVQNFELDSSTEIHQPLPEPK